MHPIQRVYNAAVWAAQPFLRSKLARRAHAEPVYGVAVPERFAARSFTHAGIGQDQRHAFFLRLQDQIRPDLSFNQHPNTGFEMR